MSAGVPEPTQASPAPPTKPAYKGWAGIRRAFGTPSALMMAVLGLGCGLPFLPIASMTLTTQSVRSPRRKSVMPPVTIGRS